MDMTNTQNTESPRPPRSGNDERRIAQMIDWASNFEYGTPAYKAAMADVNQESLEADARAFDRVATKLEWWALGGKDGSPQEVHEWRKMAAESRERGNAFRAKHNL
jgi:hypothetical protein